MICFLLLTSDSSNIIGCYKRGGEDHFDNAISFCQRSGGYLLAIDDAKENNAVAGKVKPCDNAILMIKHL